jgi:hypothetical protein
MVGSGQIVAQRVGRSWVIEQAEVNQRVANRRPLSPRMAGLLVNAMSGNEPVGLDAQERFFLGKYVEHLRSYDDPLRLLHSWMRSRQIHVVDVAANLPDIPEIAADLRVVASGISDPRAGLSAAGEFEGYIGAADLDGFLRNNLLVVFASPNIRLHVVAERPSEPVGLGLVIADLVDWNRPREDGRALELLKGIEWRR